LAHPRWFNRAGLPSHLEPWRSLAGATGNDFEVNFVPDYRILHDAGYNVLAYDMRNFGQSGKANDGVFSAGIYESRDVIGSLDYVRMALREKFSSVSRNACTSGSS
jgi:alpha/beta superfamily hydrolase